MAACCWLQVRKFKPSLVSIGDASKVGQLKELIKDVHPQPESAHLRAVCEAYLTLLLAVMTGDAGINAVAEHRDAVRRAAACRVARPH